MADFLEFKGIDWRL